MSLKFVDIETVTGNGDSRNVSLSYNWNVKPHVVILLGDLPHNTQIIINQELVDNLQKIVDHFKEIK